MKEKILKLIYKFLAFITKLYIKNKKIFVIGITGSVGKTSCRLAVYQILKKFLNKDNFKIYTSPKNFNSEIGFPFATFEIEKYNGKLLSLLAKIFIMFSKFIYSYFLKIIHLINSGNKTKKNILLLEYGVDKPGDMDFLLKITKPEIGILTRIDFVHAGNGFKNIDEIFNEKFKLIQNSKIGYLNYEDEIIRNKIQNIQINTKLEFYNKKDEFSFEYKKDKNNKIISLIKYNEKIITTNLIGKQNLVNVILGIKILENNFNYKLPNKLEINIDLLPGRFSIFEGISDSIIIDSSYNAAPESMKKVIENVIEIKNKLYPDYKLGLILGDMRELGEFSEKKHKELYNRLKDKADLIITVGQETKKYFEIPENHKFIKSNEAGKWLKNYIKKDDNKRILLFKGSQNTIFLEEAVKTVLKNKNDISKLPRQSKNRLIKKEKFFRS